MPFDSVLKVNLCSSTSLCSRYLHSICLLYSRLPLLVQLVVVCEPVFHACGLQQLMIIDAPVHRHIRPASSNDLPIG